MVKKFRGKYQGAPLCSNPYSNSNSSASSSGGSNSVSNSSASNSSGGGNNIVCALTVYSMISTIKCIQFLITTHSYNKLLISWVL